MQLALNKKPFNSTYALPNWDETDFFSPELIDLFRDLPEKSRVQKWLPKVDISETEQAYELLMDLPNIKPEDLTIEYDNDYITIAGKTTREQKEQKKNWYRLEREVGKFQRSFHIPEAADLEHMTAQLDQGTLLITIPKFAAKMGTAKKILPVKINSHE